MLDHLLQLALVGAVVFGVTFWWQTQGVKQLAYRAAARRCEELGLQLLDQSVVLRGVDFGRDGGGRLRLRRKFVFEFSSTGAERYRGVVWMQGPRPQHIELEPHRL